MAIARILRRAFILAALGFAGLAALAPFEGMEAAEKKPARLVAAIDIKGAIGPATSDYFSRAMEKARAMGASAIVVRMDTPGGLSTAMRSIIQDIITAPAPVITYVTPGGARAASAGTYILYASHVAAMAPGTNLGAATPVPMKSPLPGGGGSPKKDKKDKGKTDKDKKDAKADKKDGKKDKGKKDAKADKDKKDKDEDKDKAPAAGDASSRKAVNDARAYIRSLAQMRGRNVEWAEKAVSEAASLSSEEALKANVIDLIADNMADLLTKADGRVVKLPAGETKVATKGAIVRDISPDWRAKLLAVITNPNIAYILLLAGIYGIMFEFYNPGIIFSGVFGAICLVLAFYALHVLPVNYAGVALIILGVAFMAAEAMLPSFGALGFGGIVALAIGSVILIDTDMPGFGISWAVIGSVVAASAVISFTVLAMAARAWKLPLVSGREAMIEAPARVLDWDGTEGHVRVRGEVWQARADASFAAGEEVRVTAMDGLVLQVGPAATTKGTDNGFDA
ncbi:MAG: nodulation protein NfeD [Alphaproteobacteria bacterium]|nr:nodulation protein NfeD [Alphaproteobacteria bacterium]